MVNIKIKNKMNLQLFASGDVGLNEELNGFIPTEQANGIVKDVTKGSSILKLSDVVPMKSGKKKFTVEDGEVSAYWVKTGKAIGSSKVGWKQVEMEANKLAVIIVAPKEHLEDSTINVFNELKPRIAKAFHKAIDKACIFGIDSPFDTSIYEMAKAKGNVIIEGTNGEGKLDLDVSDCMALIEDDYDVDGFVCDNGMKNRLRKLRDTSGNALFVPGVGKDEFYNCPISFNKKTSFDRTKAILIGGEWENSKVGMRQGIQYEVSKEGTVGGVNLFETDQIAIKCTMRMAYVPLKESFCILEPKVG